MPASPAAASSPRIAAGEHVHVHARDRVGEQLAPVRRLQQGEEVAPDLVVGRRVEPRHVRRRARRAGGVGALEQRDRRARARAADLGDHALAARHGHRALDERDDLVGLEQHALARRPADEGAVEPVLEQPREMGAERVEVGIAVGAERRGDGGEHADHAARRTRVSRRPDARSPSLSDRSPLRQPRQDRVDPAPEIRAAGHGVRRLAGGRDPRHEHVEVELADQLQALHVGVAVARLEHGRDPLALAQVDRVAREQRRALPAAPQEARRSARMPRGRDHLEVVAEPMATRRTSPRRQPARRPARGRPRGRRAGRSTRRGQPQPRDDG